MTTETLRRRHNREGGRPSTIMDEWARLEATLTTTEVDDLLDTAAARLAALAGGPLLPRSVVVELLEALRHVDVARAHLHEAEQRIEPA
jgi:hypothetical protein